MRSPSLPLLPNILAPGFWLLASGFWPLSSTLLADDLTIKMLTRVSEEAEAFQRLAPQVLGQETLHQRTPKPPSRFHPRVGEAAKAPPKPEWQDRTVISEYGFSSFNADPSDLHELRQVTSVNGKKVADTKRAQTELASAITATDDARKKEMLEQFEKYGLRGAVTDYGQALLLFTRRGIERYEFTLKGSNWLNGQRAQIFSFRQLDGPEALTLIDGKKSPPGKENAGKENGGKENAVHRLRLEGEIWVRADNLLPLRVTIIATTGEKDSLVREEAAIDYAMSDYGALLPTKTDHRETRGGRITAENEFVYSNFKKFGASSDIKFR